MAAEEQYGTYQIRWLETGERCVALVRTAADEDSAAIIEASVSEGMDVLKTRTYAAIDAKIVDAYRPNLLAPNHASPVRAFASFLIEKERELGEPLSALAESPERLSTGWVLYYQSRAYLQTGSLSDRLVGHGPVVVADDGRLIEGGSLDRDPEEMLTR